MCTKCRVFSVQPGRTCTGFQGLHKGKKLSSEVLKVVTRVNIVLWRVASCSLLAKHKRFKGTYRLPLTRKMEAAESTKDNIFTCLHQLLVFLAFNIRQVNIIPNLQMNQFESGRSCCPTWLYNLNDVCKHTFYRMHYVHNIMKWNVITASFLHFYFVLRHDFGKSLGQMLSSYEESILVTW